MDNGEWLFNALFLATLSFLFVLWHIKDFITGYRYYRAGVRNEKSLRDRFPDRW